VEESTNSTLPTNRVKSLLNSNILFIKSEKFSHLTVNKHFQHTVCRPCLIAYSPSALFSIFSTWIRYVCIVCSYHCRHIIRRPCLFTLSSVFNYLALINQMSSNKAIQTGPNSDLERSCRNITWYIHQTVWKASQVKLFRTSDH
jgi:hypothetical protein